MDSIFFNVGGESVASGSTSGIAGYSDVIKIVADLGIQYLYAKKEKKKYEELIQRISELNTQEKEKLKKLLEKSLNEVAKTQVIIEFLNEKKINDLEAETKKKRIVSLIALGIGVIIMGLMFYKLNKQNG
jgi:hypothetical protein